MEAVVEKGDFQAAENLEEAFSRSLLWNRQLRQPRQAGTPKKLSPLQKHPRLLMKIWIKAGRLKARVKAVRNRPVKFRL